MLFPSLGLLLSTGDEEFLATVLAVMQGIDSCLSVLMPFKIDETNTFAVAVLVD